ncbi:hypothetical protein KEJ34_02885 [Candidatus Bathyarchaeota archaeon]|nr:hypothetical protein [Candidatus Bathyarchaeota archaeon]
MEIDFLLPLSIFTIAASSIFLYEKFEKKMRGIFEGKKLSMREVVIMVLSMGIMVTLVAFMPDYAIQILFIFAYAYMLLVFAYIILGKWFLAIFPPAIFVVTYLLVRNIYVVNIFAAIFSIMVIIYLSPLFPWKITLAFAALLTMMDVIQVFWTGYMIESASKMIGLYLPVALILPTYPSQKLMAIGIGDIFLSGLLSIQTALKYKRKVGLLSAAMISFTLFIFEFLILNLPLKIAGFPATLIVLLGWFSTMGLNYLKNENFSQKS